MICLIIISTLSHHPGLIEDLAIEIETANILLPLAHYFGLRDFEAECAKRLEDTVTPANVCQSFGIVHVLDNGFTAKCIKVMQLHIRTILDDGSLMNMHDAALTKILSRNELNIISEIDLLVPLLKWARTKCGESELLEDSVNLRTMVKDRIHLIRFTAMSGDEFSNSLSMVGADFFTEKEISEIMFTISIGADYKEKAVPRSLIGLPVNRLELNKLSHQSAFSVFDIIIQAKDKTNQIFLFGFELINEDTKIYEISGYQGKAVEYIRTGGHVIFKSSPQFISNSCNNYCILKVAAKTTRHFKTSEKTEDSNIEISSGYETIMKSFLYYA